MEGRLFVNRQEPGTDTYPWATHHVEICVEHEGVKVHLIKETLRNTKRNDTQTNFEVKPCDGSCANMVALSDEGEREVRKFLGKRTTPKKS
jgi:hypothetical protein